MKIRYVTYARIPTERANGFQISKTCEALAKRGVDVELVIPNKNRHEKSERNKNLFDFYGIEKVFSVRKIWVPPFLCLGDIGIFLQNIFFSIVVGTSLVCSPKDTVIYSRQPGVLLIPAMFGKKTVLESHEGRWTLSVRIAYFFGMKFMTITRAMKDMYIGTGVKASDVEVVTDSVDLSLFENLPSKNECRRILGVSEKEKVVMYTGSFGLYDWKGLDIFLDASNIMKGNATFFAVGGTKKEIEKLQGKYPCVKFVEKRPQKEIPKFLFAADVLVIPNKKGNDVSEFYTSPMKLFEYLAAGVPIVASGVTSILEIVDEQSAVIVEPNDPVALARGIGRVLDDPKLANRLATSSKELSKRYSWNERARIIEESIHHFYERR